MYSYLQLCTNPLGFLSRELYKRLKIAVILAALVWSVESTYYLRLLLRLI